MEVTSNSVMEFKVFLQLTEPEARALNALTLYGVKSFLQVFYEKLGEHYMKPNEEGLISLFNTVKDKIPIHLDRIDKTRQTFKENNPNEK